MWGSIGEKGVGLIYPIKAAFPGPAARGLLRQRFHLRTKAFAAECQLLLRVRPESGRLHRSIGPVLGVT